MDALGAESQAPPRQARRWPNLHLPKDFQLAGIAKVAVQLRELNTRFLQGRFGSPGGRVSNRRPIVRAEGDAGSPAPLSYADEGRRTCDFFGHPVVNSRFTLCVRKSNARGGPGGSKPKSERGSHETRLADLPLVTSPSQGHRPCSHKTVVVGHVSSQPYVFRNRPLGQRSVLGVPSHGEVHADFPPVCWVELVVSERLGWPAASVANLRRCAPPRARTDLPIPTWVIDTQARNCDQFFGQVVVPNAPE